MSFVVERDRVPLLEAALEGAGSLAVTLGDAGDEPQLEPAPGDVPLWSRVRLTALFPDDPDSRARTERLARVLAAEASAPPRCEALEDRAWERVWLEGIGPLRFGRRLWVCPRGQRAEDPDALSLELDPGLAFGTGHHTTTALCLTWLDSSDLAGKTLIDYGCGSGILAIAALRLGAARAIAVDHDPQALEAAEANACENRVGDRLLLCLPGDLPEVKADFLVANILAGTLIELAPRLAGLTCAGGGLALSGILREQVEGVSAAYLDGFDLEPPSFREEWALVSGRRRQGPEPALAGADPG